MYRLENRVVLITGASSGIGAELARQFLEKGALVCGLARRADRLEAMGRVLDPGGLRTLWLKADVTNEAEVKEAVKKCVEKFQRIDIAIANAGFGVAGKVSEISIEDYRRQFNTNIFGVLYLTYAVEKYLEASQGQLVLMGSVAGFVPLPGNSAYTMSKFSVRALASALCYEWKEKKIGVTHLAPGFVDSEIRKVNNQGDLKEDHPDPIPSWIRCSTSSAARQMIKAIEKRKSEQIITGHGNLIVLVNQYFPKLIPWIIGRFGIKSRPEPA